MIAANRLPHSILPEGQRGVRLIDGSHFDSGPAVLLIAASPR